jgi:hypothetical protein
MLVLLLFGGAGLAATDEFTVLACGFRREAGSNTPPQRKFVLLQNFSYQIKIP